MEDNTPLLVLVWIIVFVVAAFVVLEYIKFKKSPESTHYDFLGPKKEDK